ncbi:MAG: hypothetical protein V3V47_03280 [Desulfobacteria bacterium]
MADDDYSRERDPFRRESIDNLNVVNQNVPDKRDNNQIIKLAMVFPPMGIVTYG